MSWDFIVKIFSFTGVKEESVWQDIFITSLILPFSFFLIKGLFSWWEKKKPLKQLFNGFLDKNQEVFIFHSQLSGAYDDYTFNPEQKYIVRYPDPSPTDKSRLTEQRKRNIDPVLSQKEGECLANTYNILGEAGKTKFIKIGDLIQDWDIWSKPLFSLGFNPKTHKLIEKCEPIHFKLSDDALTLKLKNVDVIVDSFRPNDGGIIQKTFIKNTQIPIFILAGLGTLGTGITSHYLRNNSVSLGKLYGDKSFCILLSAKEDEGNDSIIVRAVYPNPSWDRVMFHPFAYLKFKRNIYPNI